MNGMTAADALIPVPDSPSSHDAQDVDDDREFDWRDTDSLIVPSQDAIAVYTAQQGGVVLRQQRNDLSRDGEDDIIWFGAEHAPAIAAAILKAAGLDGTAP